MGEFTGIGPDRVEGLGALPEGEMHLVLHPPREGSLRLRDFARGDELTFSDGIVTVTGTITNEGDSLERGMQLDVTTEETRAQLHGRAMGSYDADIGKTLYGQVVPGLELVVQVVDSVSGRPDLRSLLLPPYQQQ